MEFDFNVYLLSHKFIEDYPLSSYPELMYKYGRPYNCLLIETNDEYLICIPFRSHINHTNAYMFKKTKRSKFSRSGLDYSKVVIIKDGRYLSYEKAVVDDDEYSETVKNMNKIVADISEYVNKYILHTRRENILPTREFDRKYKYSTLKYFHKELGIE